MPDRAFHYSGDELFCESVPLAYIAAHLETPIYVYSHSVLQDRIQQYKQAVNELPVNSLICYSLKANSNPSLLRLMVAAGLGADVTSDGELFLALHVDFPAEKIVFSGVGKQLAEIEAALRAGIKALHVESEAELETVASAAAAIQKPAPVAIRVNPDVAAPTHPGIQTGVAINKFGVGPDLAIKLVQKARRDPFLRIVGLAIHIGSQVADLEPYRAASQILAELARQLLAEGVPLEYLDVGGGLGIDYAKPAPEPISWVRAATAAVAETGLAVLCEPGRSIAGPAGVLLTSVVYAKKQGSKSYLIVDAGMTDLIRPALYDAFHPIWPVKKNQSRETGDGPSLVDVVGPVCETTDTLGRERPLGHCQAGDLLAIMQAGAYGYAMSSNYNGRLRPAEALINGREFTLIRRRQAFDDLLQGT